MSGKRDRPSHFQIDEHTLEYKENPVVNDADDEPSVPVSERKYK